MEQIIKAAEKVIKARALYNNYRSTKILDNATSRCYRSRWRRANDEFLDLIYTYQETNNIKLSHDPEDYI